MEIKTLLIKGRAYWFQGKLCFCQRSIEMVIITEPPLCSQIIQIRQWAEWRAWDLSGVAMDLQVVSQGNWVKVAFYRVRKQTYFYFKNHRIGHHKQSIARGRNQTKGLSHSLGAELKRRAFWTVWLLEKWHSMVNGNINKMKVVSKDIICLKLLLRINLLYIQ